jgi:hypothetical protein
MIVFAVNDRRSPAESMNGHAGSSPGGTSVENLELAEKLGNAELHPAVVGLDASQRFVIVDRKLRRPMVY